MPDADMAGLREALERIDRLCDMDRTEHPLFESIRVTVAAARAYLLRAALAATEARPETDLDVDRLAGALFETNEHPRGERPKTIHPSYVRWAKRVAAAYRDTR